MFGWRTWSRVEKLTLIGLVIAALSLLVALSRTSGKAGTSNANIAGTTRKVKGTGTTTNPTEHSTPTYVEALHPSEGDRPERGETRLDGRDYSHSIFYEEIGGISTASSGCHEEDNCRATFYQLGGRYSLFTADFGIFAHGTSAAGQLATGEWRVAVDGKVESKGKVVANTTPESISVPLHGGQVLELRITVEEPGIAESNTGVWGNARVQ
jgi:hypothetical protein